MWALGESGLEEVVGGENDVVVQFIVGGSSCFFSAGIFTASITFDGETLVAEGILILYNSS